MKRNPSFDYVTKEITTDDGLPAKYRILFHCFNPNGAYARLKVMQEAISQWTKDHPERPNGVLFVHGSLNDYPRARLFEALDAPQKRKAVTSTITLAISNVESAIVDGYHWLETPSEWPEPKGTDK